MALFKKKAASVPPPPRASEPPPSPGFGNPQAQRFIASVCEGDLAAATQILSEWTDVDGQVQATREVLSLLDESGRQRILTDNSWLGRSLAGHVLIRQAWDARGSGLGKNVSAEAARVFHSKLRLADEVLLDTLAEEPDKGIIAWIGLLPISRGLELSLDEKRRRFRALDTRVPRSLAAYSDHLNGIGPRWGGSESAIDGFIAEVCRDEPPGSPVRVLPIIGRQWRTSVAMSAQFQDVSVANEVVSVAREFDIDALDDGQVPGLVAMNWLSKALAHIGGQEAAAHDLFQRIGTRLVGDAWLTYNDSWGAFREARERVRKRAHK